MADANYSVESFSEMQRIAQAVREHGEEYDRIQKEITSLVDNLHTAFEGADSVEVIRKFKEFSVHLHNMAVQIQNDATVLDEQRAEIEKGVQDALTAASKLPQ